MCSVYIYEYTVGCTTIQVTVECVWHAYHTSLSSTVRWIIAWHYAESVGSMLDSTERNLNDRKTDPQRTHLPARADLSQLSRRTKWVSHNRCQLPGSDEGSRDNPDQDWPSVIPSILDLFRSTTALSKVCLPIPRIQALGSNLYKSSFCCLLCED